MEIVQYPDPILHQVSAPIDSIDGSVLELASEMLSNLDEYLGLAAVQIGELKRLIVVRHNPMITDDGLALINPEIVKSKGEFISHEGCLSIKHGELIYPVPRAKILKVKALNLKGEIVTYKAHDVFARCLQHEIDHLNGILVNQKR